MELTKEGMLEIGKSRKNCEFCFDSEKCDDCEKAKAISYEDLWEFYDKVIDLLQADADGRLVELPCKVGDTVFIIVTKRKNFYKKELFSYVQQSRLTWNNMQRVLNCYGETAFLTREEAEAALEKMGGGEE